MAQLEREFTERHKYESLLRELLDAPRNRKSEQLSNEQLSLFEAAWKARAALDATGEATDGDDGITPGDPADGDGQANADNASKSKRRGRRPLAGHLERERIVHDLAESEKHCACCGKDLRLIEEETSERYDYIPAKLRVILDVCLKYACDCTVKTAAKPPQPIRPRAKDLWRPYPLISRTVLLRHWSKSTASASLLAHVIVSKHADHQPLHRQERMFERHGIDLSRKTMGGWMAQCAELLDPLFEKLKQELFKSKVIGTDDTSVKVLDPKLPFARTGRIWPYLGDIHHPVVVYDYTPTRGRAGPAKFLEGYKGYLQADAYSVYDAFFTPARGLTEVGCWMHARRYIFKALETDQERMGPAMHLIARLYRVEECAREMTAADRCALRQRVSAKLLEKLHAYLLELRGEVLPKSPSGAAVRYILNQWDALTRLLDDGELEIDNGAAERANRDIAIGRNNWTFFGSDKGGKTAAVLRSFVASCKRAKVEPFAWFNDVLGRIAEHSLSRLGELLPHNWKPFSAA
jgi:transposase